MSTAKHRPAQDLATFKAVVRSLSSFGLINASFVMLAMFGFPAALLTSYFLYQGIDLNLLDFVVYGNIATSLYFSATISIAVARFVIILVDSVLRIFTHRNRLWKAEGVGTRMLTAKLDSLGRQVEEKAATTATLRQASLIFLHLDKWRAVKSVKVAQFANRRLQSFRWWGYTFSIAIVFFSAVFCGFGWIFWFVIAAQVLNFVFMAHATPSKTLGPMINSAMKKFLLDKLDDDYDVTLALRESQSQQREYSRPSISKRLKVWSWKIFSSIEEAYEDFLYIIKDVRALGLVVTFLAIIFGVSKSISDSVGELVANNGSMSHCVSPYLYNSIGLIARDIESQTIIVIPTGGYTFSYAPCR